MGEVRTKPWICFDQIVVDILLFSLYDKEEISYGKTVKAIFKALLKEKTEIAKILSMMESFNLLEWKKNRKGEKAIYLIAGSDFIEKALKIYEILKGYKTQSLGARGDNSPTHEKAEPGVRLCLLQEDEK